MRLLVPDNWEIGSLLVNCFYRLDPNLKQHFNELLDKRIIDKVIWAMIREGLFPKWLSDKMSFGASRGQLNGLREALTAAVTDCLIGIDKSSHYYFINFGEDELAGMSCHVGLTEQEVLKLAKELNDRLLNTDQKKEGEEMKTLGYVPKKPF